MRLMALPGIALLLFAGAAIAGPIPKTTDLLARSAGPIPGSGGQVTIFTPTTKFVMTGYCTTSGSKDNTFIVGTSADNQPLRIFASSGGGGNPNGGGAIACVNVAPGIAFAANQPISFSITRSVRSTTSPSTAGSPRSNEKSGAGFSSNSAPLAWHARG